MPEEELTTSIEQVAEVLQQLKQKVRERRHELGAAGPFLDERTAALNQPALLERVHSTMRVNPHLPIAWPTWPKGLWPKIVALTQKMARRLLQWYINPIVEQQNRHNAAVAQVLDTLWWEVVRLRVQVSEQQHRHDPEGE